MSQLNQNLLDWVIKSDLQGKIYLLLCGIYKINLYKVHVFTGKYPMVSHGHQDMLICLNHISRDVTFKNTKYTLGGHR